MGLSIPPELSLDCRSSLKSFGEFLAEISMIHNAPEKISKIDDYVNRLRDEMKKIDAFKRELPLCMLLLNDAILMMNEELTRCKRSNREPVLEQFIPLKDNSTEIESVKEKDVVNSRDKRSWMSSVQLWNFENQSSNNEPTLKLDNQCNKKKRTKEETNQPNMNDLLWSWKNSTGGRAFVPFKACANVVRKEDGVELVGVPGLSLGPPEIKKSIGFTSKSSCNRPGLSLRKPGIKKSTGFTSKSSCNKQRSSFVVDGKRKSKSAQKQRRRWSPELHRRFLYALQKLGGSQVATPKQIRELMQVDNLTNDEVKSHLQKYRLHNQRIHQSTKTSNANPLSLGGLWASQEQLGESSKQSNSSGSPHGPLNVFGSSSGTSMTEEDSTEDEDEDEKSESHCWKSHIHLSLKA